jgi:hypothetical protein
MILATIKVSATIAAACFVIISYFHGLRYVGQCVFSKEEWILWHVLVPVNVASLK